MALIHDSFCQAVDQMAENMVTGQFYVEYFFGAVNLFVAVFEQVT